jgi:hypothetical protein
MKVQRDLRYDQEEKRIIQKRIYSSLNRLVINTEK